MPLKDPHISYDGATHRPIPCRVNVAFPPVLVPTAPPLATLPSVGAPLASMVYNLRPFPCFFVHVKPQFQKAPENPVNRARAAEAEATAAAARK